MKKLIVILLLLWYPFFSSGQGVPLMTKPKLAWIDETMLFKYTLSDVAKTDTVEWEQYIIPQGIKQGEKWIVHFVKIEAIPVMIDNTFFALTGTWTKSTTASNHYGQTFCYSNIVGNTASYTFTDAAKVEIMAEKVKTHGKFSVSIDGVLVQPEVDLYSATPLLPDVVYSMSFGPSVNASHTIKITVLGTKNPLATSAYVVLDALRITKQ